MKGYAYTVFTQAEREYLRKATLLVEQLPDYDPREERPLRCHELARAVAFVLGLPVQDGRYGSVEHTWIWAGPIPDELLERLASDAIVGVAAARVAGLPNILDVYVPGALPQVQLLHRSRTRGLDVVGQLVAGDPTTVLEVDRRAVLRDEVRT